MEINHSLLGESAMGVYKKLTTDTVLFAISNFSSKILVFLLLPLYTNFLTTDEYGIVDLINNLVIVLFPILTLSVIESILRFSFSKNIRKSDVLNIGLFSVLFSVVMLLISTPVVLWLKLFPAKYWMYFLLTFLGYTTTTTLSYYLRGINKVKFVAIQGILQTVLMVTSNLISLLILDLGFDGYLFSLIFSYFCTLIIIFFLSGTYQDLLDISLNRNLLKNMLSYSIPLIPSKIAWWLNNSLDKYFIIMFVGIGASGLYSVAHKIPSILSVFTEIFNQAWQLSAIEIYESRDQGDKSGIYAKVHQFYVSFIVLCAGGIMMLSKFLGRILFSGDFFEGWKLVPILLVSAVFSSLSGYYHSVFRAAKMTKTLGVTVISGAITNCILNLALIPHFGTIGAAYATMFGFFVEWIIACYFSNKKVCLNINWSKIIGSFCLLLLEAIIMSADITNTYLICFIIFSCLFIVNIREVCNILHKIIFLLPALKKH